MSNVSRLSQLSHFVPETAVFRHSPTSVASGVTRNRDSLCDISENIGNTSRSGRFSVDHFPSARVAGAGGPYTPLKGGYEARSVLSHAWGSVNEGFGR